MKAEIGTGAGVGVSTGAETVQPERVRPPGVRQASRMPGLKPSEIRKALIAAADPGMISLAGGVPAAEAFPAERFREAFDRVLRDRPGQFLQYGRTEGYGPLREFVAERAARTGLRCSPEQVLITNGSQQGLDLVGRLLLDPGDRVAVESPSYLGALETFRQYQAGFSVIPTDECGIRPDLLEERLVRDRETPDGRRVRMLYTMPNFANPSGITLSLERRHALAELAARHRLPVLEDDAYGELRYDGTTLPSLAALHPDAPVIRLGSFSKILSPGLRIGWIICPPELIEPLQSLKERADLHSATGAQMAVMQVLEDGFLDPHVAGLIDLYRTRRDAMLEQIAAQLPATVRHTRPDGGFFVWCSLPPGVDAVALLERAMAAGVAFVPGRDFHADGGAAEAVRLNFSGVPAELIREGLGRLGAVLGRALHPEPAVRAGSPDPRSWERATT